ncbi:hypothetical protein AB0M45_21800 [Nocardia sp. NPDC051787]|uniref:hypothetical protein n=1 Tax=Nocardia sp. NPDC051787 TaxID=3155415 RepID=UPI003440BE09
MSQPGPPQHDPAPGEPPAPSPTGPSLRKGDGGAASMAQAAEPGAPQGLPPSGSGQPNTPQGQAFPEGGQPSPQGQPFAPGPGEFPQGQPFPPGGQPFQGDPAQFPPHGGPHVPPQGQGFQQPPPYGQPWPPQQPRNGRGGVIALVLVLVVVVLAGGGAGAYFVFFQDDSNKKPVIDTSMDLADAPMGCGIFTEAELAPFIPGAFTTEPTEILGGDRDHEKSAQCSFSNQKTRAQGQPVAWIIVTTKLLKANQSHSGVQKAKTELGRRPGSAVGVPGTDDDRFREMKSSRGNVNDAEISILYRNVVINISYHYDGMGANKFTQPLMKLSTMALEKVTG